MPSLEQLAPRRFEWNVAKVDYLTSSANLFSWGTDSLIKRTSDFNQKFNHDPISVYRLRKLYKEHRIKQRVLHIDIDLTPS